MLIFLHFSIKETENLIFSVKLIFISLMNTISGIFTRGFATRENTAFGVHSVKYINIKHRLYYNELQKMTKSPILTHTLKKSDECDH